MFVPLTPLTFYRRAEAVFGRKVGVVDGERHGREVVYRLVDEHLSHIVVDAVTHVEEE